MKYALFISTRYYPSGGIDDFAGNYDDVDAAKAVVNGLVESMKRVHSIDSTGDLSAQIAACGEDGLSLMARYSNGVWVDDTDTPTLERKGQLDELDEATGGSYLADDIADFLHPERVTERERANAEREAKDVKAKKLEHAYTAARLAQRTGDDAGLAKWTALIDELESE